MGSVDFQTLHLADDAVLEAFYKEQTGTHTRFVQLSSGAADIRVASLCLGSLRLVQVQGEGQHFWQDEMVADEWRLAFQVDASGSSTFGRIETTPHLATILRPGNGATFRTGGYYKTLEILFEAALAAEQGWNCIGHAAAEAPNYISTAIIASAEAAFEGLVSRAGQPSNPVLAEELEERLLDQIDQLFDWWALSLDAPPAIKTQDARTDIVLRAARLLRDPDYAVEMDVETLCRELDVPRRSLFFAFKTQLGIGPRRFKELVRLHRLRGHLHRQMPGHTTVSKEALKLGFYEPGRLASVYRDLFGELPSNTLRNG